MTYAPAPSLRARSHQLSLCALLAGGILPTAVAGCEASTPVRSDASAWQTTGGAPAGATRAPDPLPAQGSSTTGASPGVADTTGGAPRTPEDTAEQGASTGTAADAAVVDGGLLDTSTEAAESADGAMPGAGDAAVATDAEAEAVTPQDDHTVWIAGDSTVANGLTPCPRGWGAELGALFNEHITVENRAAGGRSVRTWMYVTTDAMQDGECLRDRDAQGAPVLEARWAEMLAGMKTGDFLLVQFGINDGSPTCPRHVGSAAFKEHYGELAAAAQERGVQPIFFTPVSAIKCSGSTAVGSRGFLSETYEVAATFDVPVIDMHALSIDLYNELRFCPVPLGDVSASTGGPVGDFFCDDHTHFAEPGARQIARLVAQALIDQDIELGDFVEVTP